MAEKKTAVCGVYQDAKQAEASISGLLAAGFSRDAIAISRPVDKESAKAADSKVVTVHCASSEQADRAKELLERTGAKEVSTSGDGVEEVFVES